MTSLARGQHRCSILPVATALILAPLVLFQPVEAQVYRMAELNTRQIRSLERAKTVILLPGGVLEEHGPYLPSFTDGYGNERLTDTLARAIASRPGWTAVVFPTIPLGAGGANEIGGQYSFPGTYGVRPATLRAVFMDLAAELGEQGFRWVFIIHGHGSPRHNRVLDEAGDFFRDTYGGKMVHLTGIISHVPRFDSLFTALAGSQARTEDGFTVHAGLSEHARLMAVRPDLIPADLPKARSITGKDFQDLRKIAAADGWPGYFGAPRYATIALGRRLLEAEMGSSVSLALSILDGFDERQLPRYSEQIATVPGVSAVMEGSARNDAKKEQKQLDWLARDKTK